MTKPPALLVITPGFPANEADGNCLPFLQTFVACMKEEFHDVEVIVFSLHYPGQADRYEWKGCKVFSFNGQNKAGINRFLLWRKVQQQFQLLKRTYHVKGVLSFWLGEAALLGKWLARIAEAPHHCWIQGQDAREGNKFIKWIKPQPDNLIAISDVIAENLQANYGIRPNRIITNGIDKRKFRESNAERLTAIIGAGSLIKLKQFDLFIDVIAALLPQFPSLNAIIYGEGPERENLECLVREKNLQRNIQLPGEIPHDELLAAMQRSTLLLHPSSYEGFSTVTAEALYAGAHVVAFCKPMNNSYEHFHPVQHFEEMVSVTGKLLHNRELDHSPVTVASINDVCWRVADLYPGLFNTVQHVS